MTARRKNTSGLQLPQTQLITPQYNIFERMGQVRRNLAILAPQLFQIRTKDRGIIPWTPSELQLRFLNDPNVSADIILKARQLGVSTMTVLEFLAYVLFVDGFNGIIISEDLEKSKQLLGIAWLALDMLPDKYKVPVKHARENYIITEAPVYDDQKKRIGGGRGSSLYIGTAGKFTLGRGNTFHAAHCSELAFWPSESENDAETLLTGLEEAVPERPGAILRIESTANGRGNVFHQKCESAQRRLGRYRFHFFPWWFSLDDEYKKPVVDQDLKAGVLTDDEKQLVEIAARKYNYLLTPEHIQWRRDKIANKKENFWQEYPEDPDTCFLSSGSAVFYGIMDLLEHTRKRLENSAQPVLERERGIVSVKYWKMPRAGRVYAIAVDMAEGDKASSDFNAFVVGEVTEGGRIEECATGQARTSTSAFAETVMQLAHEYNGAMIAVERANKGYGLIDILLENEEGRYDFSIYHHLEFDNATGKEAKIAGFRPTRSAREAAVSRWAEDVQCGDYVVHDPLVVSQAMNFQYNPRTGKMEAPRGSFDDMLNCALILNYVKGEAEVISKVGVEEW